MSYPDPNLLPSVDVLGETLHLLRLSGTLYCQAELTAPWAIDIPPLEGLMTCIVVTAGRYWLEMEGRAPQLVEKGSLTLIPHGTPHRLSSDPRVASEMLLDIPVEKISERYEIMRYGGGGVETRVTYCVMRFDHVVAGRFIAALPRVLQIDKWDDETGQWMASTLGLITHEAARMRPGGETVITRLADILVIQAIRAWLDFSPEAKGGWLAALRDDKVGRALASIHRTPEREWTLETLAREAGMSRSGFSARFSELVGEPAMHYVAQWRLQLASMALKDTAEPLAALAMRFGYRSEAAFCRAFKRMFGVPPGSIRRAAQGA